MRKGYDHLMVTFVAVVIASFSSKLGATALDKILFIFISYALGCTIALAGHARNGKKMSKKIRDTSIKFGIALGVLNFVSFFTLLSALETGPGALIFPLLGLNVMFVVLLSMALFKERLNTRGVVGFVLALIAIFLLR